MHGAGPLLPSTATQALPGSLRAVSHTTRRLSAALRPVAAGAGHDAYVFPVAERLTLDSGGGKEITLETGEIGRQANGAVLLTCGETVLYATACCSPEATGDGSFVPFTVDYQERYSAVGRTSSGFIKREGRPRDSDTLVGRLVDRPLRPMFPKGWSCETQILEYVVSFDGVHSPEPLAITAASAALLISDIPMTKAVAGVRVGWLGGIFVVNPTIQQMKKSRLDLVMAGTRDAVLMIEGYCDFLSEAEMLQAVEAGSAAISTMCVGLEEWAGRVGKSKAQHLGRLTKPPLGLMEAVRGLVGKSLDAAFREVGDKNSFGAAVEAARQRVTSVMGGPDSKYAYSQVAMALKALESELMRNVLLSTGRRTDGRGMTEVRPIRSRAGLLPRCHGSALFTRGETQALCVTTLGGVTDALRLDGIRGASAEDVSHAKFYLQYSFPPSSVGEVGRTGAPGRRELGHGELAQRALAPIIPSGNSKEWPYTIRLESTITESNGSSSMASVCGGCLALMDAGVPITRPVAGIAMGLILEPDGRFAVLSDILGSEDAFGDMDFKVAGDAESITAFQMDIKVEGITVAVLAQALSQARAGREHILGEMVKCSPAPRGSLSEHAPFLVRKKVDAAKKGFVIGAGGKTVADIRKRSGATTIEFNDDGELEISAPNRIAGEAAVEFVQLLLEDPPAGKVFRKCKVVGIQSFGAYVEVGPGRQGLVHISELDVSQVNEVSAIWKLNDIVDVMVLDCPNGKMSLSRKAVQRLDAGGAAPKKAPATPARSALLATAGGQSAGQSAAAGGPVKAPSRGYSR